MRPSASAHGARIRTARMIRNNRNGLSYFPVDTMFSIPMRKLKIHYGPEGIGIVILILQMIYHEGYALTWDDETCCLFCRENNIDEATVGKIIEFCLERGIFDRNLFLTKKILSSAEIQKQWLKICQQSKRKGMSIEHGVSLLDLPADRNSEKGNSGNFPENSGSLPENSAQRKEKKIKEKKRKENKNKKNKSEEDKSEAKQTRAESKAREPRPASSALPKASDPGLDAMKARLKRIIREKERQERRIKTPQKAAG